MSLIRPASHLQTVAEIITILLLTYGQIQTPRVVIPSLLEMESGSQEQNFMDQRATDMTEPDWLLCRVSLCTRIIAEIYGPESHSYDRTRLAAFVSRL